jgi:hypothetical protein
MWPLPECTNVVGSALEQKLAILCLWVGKKGFGVKEFTSFPVALPDC